MKLRAASGERRATSITTSERNLRGTAGAADAIVLDIEGTTTPIAFVYDVLFPYARRRLRTYLHDPKNRDALAEPLRRLIEEAATDKERVPELAAVRTFRSAPSGGPEGQYDNAGQFSNALDWAASRVEWLMDRDIKSPALKRLQGQIWEEGYRAGELHGDVFPDVAPALARWRVAGTPVSIYSSGSELAQRLLFGTTVHGDLTPFISRFFDTSVGSKMSPDSYRRIATELNCATTGMLFVSDVTTELDAARAAGCQVRLCVRPGNRPQAPHSYEVITSFDEVAR